MAVELSGYLLKREVQMPSFVFGCWLARAVGIV